MLVVHGELLLLIKEIHSVERVGHSDSEDVARLRMLLLLLLDSANQSRVQTYRDRYELDRAI